MKTKTKGHLAALFCAFVWGTTFISTKVLLERLGPVEILFYRFLLGYGALWIINPRKFSPDKLSHELYFIGAGLTGVTIYYFCENVALTFTLASNVSIIVSTAPFFTAILASFFLKDEKLKLKFFVGFVVALLGVSLVTFNGRAVLKVNPLGDFLAFTGAFVWAVYSVIVRKMGRLGYPVAAVTRRIFFYGLVFMVPMLGVMKFEGNIGALIGDPVCLGNMLFLGIFACALCFVAWNYGVEVLGAVVSSNYIYAVPVITVVASMVVLREPITVMGGIGMLLTLAGLAISAT